MVNPWAGEVRLNLDGEERVAKLTLGALAELETELGATTMVDVVERFETGAFAARDVLAVLVAGLRGGGWQGTADDLFGVDIAGGPIQAARKAAELVARAFALPEPP